MKLLEFLGLSEPDDRNVQMHPNVEISEWISNEERDSSFAVLGGNIRQRNRVTMQGISRCFGRVGIVVLHNNEFLEEDLKHIFHLYPDLLNGYGKTPVCFINNGNPAYMPLFGMDVNRAAESIYPEISRDSPMYLQQHLYSGALKSYLSILQWRNIPITLGNLLYLCRMDPETLSTQELSRIPEAAAAGIQASLMQDHVMGQVRADVESFAGQFAGRIWNGQRNGTVSILEGLRNRGLISISLPSNHVPILNYLAAELNLARDKEMPFLLVVDSLHIGSSLVRDVVANSGRRVRKILTGSSMQELLGDQRNNGILTQFEKIVLFQCANNLTATECSEMIGSYLRKFVSVSSSKSRGAFDLFSGHGKGETISEQEYARIKPEEFMRLGDGAVLIDQEAGEVHMTRKLE